MSIRVMSHVWELDLPAKEKLLLLALADAANDFGASCYPSVATISRKTSMPERTVQRMLKSLLTSGVLSAYYDRAAGRGKLVRHFRFHLEGIPEAPKPDYTHCPKKLRDETIAAFGEACVHCHGSGDAKTGPDGQPWHVDRLTPGSKGGRYVPENVSLSCASCNQARGAKLAPVDTPSLGAILDKEGCQSEQGGVPNRAERGATGGTLSISKPSVTHPEPSDARARAEPPPTDLDPDSWDRWAQYRTSIRKPIKPASLLAAQRKLAGYGPDQAAVVEQSIANGWQGLFALKDEPPPRGATRQATDPYYDELRRGL